jgi:hypothetical protein
MKKILQIGNFVKAKRNNPNRGRVYSTTGVAPTIYNFAGGGNKGIHIIEYERLHSNRNSPVEL